MAQVFSFDHCAPSTANVIQRETGKWGYDIVSYILSKNMWGLCVCVHKRKKFLKTKFQNCGVEMPDQSF